MNASTVKVTMPSQARTVHVKFNASTKDILRRLSRSQGVYFVRSAADENALLPHVVRAQGS
jgi:hypothetical protein